jgi:hypothetical protein
LYFPKADIRIKTIMEKEKISIRAFLSFFEMVSIMLSWFLFS